MGRLRRWHEVNFHYGKERLVYHLYIINMGILCRDDMAAILYAS